MKSLLIHQQSPGKQCQHNRQVGNLLSKLLRSPQPHSTSGHNRQETGHSLITKPLLMNKHYSITRGYPKVTFLNRFLLRYKIKHYHPDSSNHHLSG